MQSNHTSQPYRTGSGGTLATLVSHRAWAVVVHAFNHSPTEEYKMGGDRSHAQSQSENLCRQDPSFWSEVEVRASG